MELIISTYYTLLNTHRSISSSLHGIFIKFIPKYSFGILFFGPPCITAFIYNLDMGRNNMYSITSQYNVSVYIIEREWADV